MTHQESIRATLLRLGVVSDLHGHPVHAEVCSAVVEHDPCDEQPPHPELNTNHPMVGTALHWAAVQRISGAALALLDCRHFILVNSRRDVDGSNALHIAAAEGLEEVVEALLAHPDFAGVSGVDRDGFTALHGAAYCGHLGCVKQLLNCPRFDAAAGAVGAFDVARPSGHWAKEAATEYDMQTALHMAASRGHADICTAILSLAPSRSNGANAINRIGSTALHMAARKRHVAVCRAILRSSEFTNLNAKDSRGFTALHWAAQEDGSGDIAEAMLLREDFEAVNSQDLRGRTASDIAEEKGHHEVRRLILHHLDVAAQRPESALLNGPALVDLLSA